MAALAGRPCRITACTSRLPTSRTASLSYMKVRYKKCGTCGTPSFLSLMLTMRRKADRADPRARGARIAVRAPPRHRAYKEGGVSEKLLPGLALGAQPAIGPICATLCHLPPANPTQRHVIQDLCKCDFTLIARHLHDERERKVNRTVEQKNDEKRAKAELVARFGHALIDGVVAQVPMWQVEPPGLFLGRGEHPMAGRVKRRVQPEDITLNLGEDAPIPPAPDGHRWGGVVHNHSALWFATWRDELMRTQKYLVLSMHTRTIQDDIIRKFDAARDLAMKLAYLRSIYTADLGSADACTRQHATAMWLIDHFGLRIGNEKDDADAVGCCSLRMSHITLSQSPHHTLTLDFVGNDSLRYHMSRELDERIWRALSDFAAKKPPADLLFDALDSASLSAYMRSLHPQLSPKVLRICNVSATLQRHLEAIDVEATGGEVGLLLAYNRASVATSHECNLVRSTLQKPTHTAPPRAAAPKAEPRADGAPTQHCERTLRSGRVVRYASTDDEAHDSGDASADEGDDAPAPSAPVLSRAHASSEAKAAAKEELRTVALTTARINYIDPRITVAFCKRSNLPLEKLWSMSMRQRCEWATQVDQDWRF